MHKINSIAIIGGGTAGWLTAAALSHHVKDINITLVESEELGTIGVGESLIPEVVRFLKWLNVDIDDVIAKTDATHKLSIMFKDFYKKNTHYMYSFGSVLNDKKYYNAYRECLFKKQVSPQNFSEIFQELTLPALKNKVFPNRDVYSLQLDATKLACYMKENYCDKVVHKIDTITSVSKSDGHITQLTTKKGETITADLFIDCTGFRGLLINELDGEYEEYNELLTDRAIVAQTPYESEEHKRKNMLSYTECTGMSAGWKWRIPLWSRMGNGYVYSSKFISDEDAEKEFRDAIGWQGETKLVKFKSGCRKEAWKGNVVCVGLSSGFIEPLESTGLEILSDRILELVNTINYRGCEFDSYDAMTYSENNYLYMNDLRLWIYEHFRLSSRTDTEFWKTYTSGKLDEYSRVDEGVKKTISTLKRNSQLHISKHAILAGNARLGPYSKDPVPENHIIELYDRWNKNKLLASKLPEHYDHLLERYYNDK